jgi:glycosyltransferase involved in cell wall biosynthesis
MEKIRIMKKKNDKRIVVGVILTHNCAQLLIDVVARIPKNAVDALIIVDDGSADNVKAVAQALGLPFFSHAHLGYGGNMTFGLSKAYDMGASYVVEIHGDGQYDPAIIPKARKKSMQHGYDLLLGTRFDTFYEPLSLGMPRIRFVANIVLSFIARMVLHVPISEFHSGFRIYSRKFIEVINLTTASKNHLFSFESIAQAKYFNLRIGQIPVQCDYKKEHTSISLRDSAVFALETFVVLYEYLLSRWGIRAFARFTPSRRAV